MNNNLFLDLPAGTQKKILKHFKDLFGFTWVELAKFLGVNRSMIFFYCKDTCKMPLRHVEKLCLASNVNIAELCLKTKAMPHCTKKVISLPHYNSQLAEFLGVLFGDGCLSKKTYAVCVTCDALLDCDYVKKVICLLFEDLFGVLPKLRIQNGAVHCWVYSKSLFEFLSTNLGFPEGKKKNKLIVPLWITKNKEFSIAFIRGLFDTDGGVHRHHKNSIQLSYTNISPGFLRQVHCVMKSLGLNPKLGKQDIWFFGNAAFDFFNIVAPKNPKHTFKFKEFKRVKKVPLTREMYAGAGIRTQVTA